MQQHDPKGAVEHGVIPEMCPYSRFQNHQSFFASMPSCLVDWADMPSFGKDRSLPPHQQETLLVGLVAVLL